MRRSLFAAALLVTVYVGLTLALTRNRETAEAPPRRETRLPRLLPGVQPSGEVQLPNQWSLRPAGRQILVGDFPVNLALHPNGKWLAVLHAGYGEHEIVIMNLKTLKKTSRVLLDQCFVGLCFSPDGKRLFASGGEQEVVHAFDFDDGLLSAHKRLPVARASEKFVVAGVAVDSAGKRLFAAGTWGNAVAVVSLDAPEKVVKVDVGKEAYPYTCLPDATGQRVFVSLWNKAAVAVVDAEQAQVAATWTTESHPTEMALSPDGKTLFVACANSTKVSVLDTSSGKSLQTLAASLYPVAPAGNTPNSLSLTPDGKLLFVANADVNNLAVFNVEERGHGKPMGFIPVGWYPTSVRYNAADKRLYVANGKGVSPKANRHGPNPLRRSEIVQTQRGQTIQEYIGGLFQGTVSVIEMPGPQRLAEYGKQAYACSPLRQDAGVTAARPEGNPIPGKVGEKSPIKYCLYIIKENRTYDQVFGDMPEGNGDPSLCLFPDKVTPNHHKLSRQFVLLDNFYVDGEVSADGHQWSMAAYCTDYVEKVWPLSYRGALKEKLPGYPSEGDHESIEKPAGGYIWDRCAEAKVSYYSFGEWVDNPRKRGQPARARSQALEGHFDPFFWGYDLDYPDQKRADRFIEKLMEFEQKGDMPQLTILRLPNDHTYGTRAGKPTPTALVADNDLALGRVVEAVSRSKFWKETALFVIEDDAQNGPDHVDAHRTVALVISPYTKHGYVDSSMYSTTSMLRTMELILGLKPMSQFDAAARPMYASFQEKPDLSVYEPVVPDVDLKEKNKATAWGADLSEKMNFAREDAADDLLLNEVIWRSVKGSKSRMPAPVRAAFVFPRVKKDEDD
jgi:DNA-binding beta-propeller fold protein YncE